MSSIKFVSWNIRGIGSSAKRTKILNHLNKLQADICLLQETHLSETEHNCQGSRTEEPIARLSSTEILFYAVRGQTDRGR